MSEFNALESIEYFKNANDELRAEVAQLRARLASAEQAVNEARPFVNECSRIASFENDRKGARAWIAAYPAE